MTPWSFRTPRTSPANGRLRNEMNAAFLKKLEARGKQEEGSEGKGGACPASVTHVVHRVGVGQENAHGAFQNILFLYGPFLESSLSLLQYCFCCIFKFCPQSRGISAPSTPGIRPTPVALEGDVLTTGPQGSPSVDSS